MEAYLHNECKLRITLNSEINAFIYYCDVWRMDKNARSTIVISGKSAYGYMCQIPKCEFLLLRYSSSCNIHINKNLLLISEFTVWHDKLLCFLELHKTLDLRHLHVFLSQPFLHAHFTDPCQSSTDCRDAASLSLNLTWVFESCKANDFWPRE